MIVKICGTTSEDDALLAVAMGADMVGFVFAPSPRQIARQKAADIVKRLPPEIVAIGVFRDEAPQRVVDMAVRSGMGGVQLHGHETAEETRWIRQRVPFVIKAFTAGDDRIVLAADYGADVILLDGPRPGSGRLFDWALTSRLPHSQALMIAGGLTPDNVADVVEATSPWGVDVVSGVERAQGVKDATRLRTFIANARAAAPDTGDAREGSTVGARGVYDWEEER